MTKLCSSLPAAGHWVSITALAAILAGCASPVVPEQSADTGYEESDTDVAVDQAPPALPDDDQPPCPEDGYIWIPGYWAYRSGDLGGGDYYWVPGAWVLPPQVGVLWTPGYWSYANGQFVFTAGYWGPHVGFYGGINYGHGYPGEGFDGGAWQGDQYSYNRAVTNVDAAHVRRTYTSSIQSRPVTKASYNGVGGIVAGPTAQEREFAAEARVAATPVQLARAQQAARSPVQISHVTANPTAARGTSQTQRQTSVAPPKKPVPPAPASDRTRTDKGDYGP